MDESEQWADGHGWKDFEKMKGFNTLVEIRLQRNEDYVNMLVNNLTVGCRLG